MTEWWDNGIWWIESNLPEPWMRAAVVLGGAIVVAFLARWILSRVLGRLAARTAGTVDDHEARFRQLSAAGVDTAIVSTPDLAAPDAMATFERLIERFADV